MYIYICDIFARIYAEIYETNAITIRQNIYKTLDLLKST